MRGRDVSAEPVRVWTSAGDGAGDQVDIGWIYPVAASIRHPVQAPSGLFPGLSCGGIRVTPRCGPRWPRHIALRVPARGPGELTGRLGDGDDNAATAVVRATVVGHVRLGE